MPDDQVTGYMIDEELADFITGQVSIQVAACGNDRLATLVRALGARLSADRSRVTVLLPRSQAEAVLRAVAANGRFAAIFNDPQTHHAVQIKGRDAVIEPATPDDKASLDGYQRVMARRLARFGVPEAFCRAMFSSDPEDLIAVSFSPSEAYGQSPGTGAGELLPQSPQT